MGTKPEDVKKFQRVPDVAWSNPYMAVCYFDVLLQKYVCTDDRSREMNFKYYLRRAKNIIADLVTAYNNGNITSQ